MRTSLGRFAVVVGILAIPSVVQAETILKNDSVGETFDGLTATAEIIEGEMYEAVFDIPSDWLPVEVLGVRVVMVKDPNKALACGRFGIDIWNEGTNMPQTTTCTDPNFNSINVRYKDPGAPIFTQDSVLDPQTNTVIGFEVRGDETRGQATFKDLRFSSINQLQGVTINPVIIEQGTTTVRVAVRALDRQCTANGMIGQGDHFPILLSDDDGVSQPLYNFIYGEPLVAGFSLCQSSGSQHFAWEDMGPFFMNSQPGDWVLRLILNRDDPTMGDDMGMGEDLGMSSLDAGTDTGGDEFDSGSGSDMSVPIQDGGGANNGANNANNGNNNGNNNLAGDGLMIDSVTPDEGPNDRSVEIVIIGSGFEPGAEVLLDADGIGVTETRSGRIRATVPEGLTPGTYDLVVTNPDGETGILMDGYTVTDGMQPDDEGGSSRGGAAGGCCSEVRGAPSTSALGTGAIALLLACVVGIRRRWN